jgi:hypothetical protein
MDDLFLLVGSFAGQVTNGAGDDGNLMPQLYQRTRHLMVTGATWFIDGCESLVNEQNMHIPILL